MDARLHEVTARLKENETYYARIGDFGLGAETTVPASTVLDEPGWAPYCVDTEQSLLVFVKLPPEIDLAEAPFVHTWQYRNATHLLTMPLTAARTLASALPVPNVIWIFSMGRCGTTLASHVLNGSERVWSLSEPAVYDGRDLRLAPAAGITVPELIATTTKLWFAVRFKKALDTLAIKLRSQSLYSTNLFYEATPDARYVFMYRDAISWTASFHQFVTSIGVPEVFDHKNRDFNWSMMSDDAPQDFLARYLDPAQPTVHADSFFPIGWMYHLEAYRKFLKAGVPFMALRYNELNTYREATVRKLFEHCGLSADGIPRALEAFQKDSQEGTMIQRDGGRRRLGPESAANSRAVLAKNPAYADPDLIIEDIYTP